MPQVGVVTDYFGILTIHRDLNFTFWESQGMLAFPIPRDAVTNGNGDTTTVSRCTNFDTF